MKDVSVLVNKGMLYSLKRILERYSKMVSSTKVTSEYKSFYFLLESIYTNYSDEPLNKEYLDFNVYDFNKHINSFLNQYKHNYNITTQPMNFTQLSHIMYTSNKSNNKLSLNEKDLSVIYITIKHYFDKLNKLN